MKGIYDQRNVVRIKKLTVLNRILWHVLENDEFRIGPFLRIFIFFFFFQG